MLQGQGSMRSCPGTWVIHCLNAAQERQPGARTMSCLVLVEISCKTKCPEMYPIFLEDTAAESLNRACQHTLLRKELSKNGCPRKRSTA